jgi:hypothetical protein
MKTMLAATITLGLARGAVITPSRISAVEVSGQIAAYARRGGQKKTKVTGVQLVFIAQ